MKKLISALLKNNKIDLLRKVVEAVAARGYAKIGKGRNTLYINTPGSQKGVRYVIVESFGNYFVLSVKQHRSFDITFVSNKFKDYKKDSLSTIRALASIAQQHNLLKYFKENLNPRQFTKLVLTKEDFHLNIFNEWFPDLEYIEKEEEERVYNFKVTFDDAVKGINKENVIDFIKTASKIVENFGLDKILYGKVFIVDKLPGNRIAVYDPGSDMIKVSRRAAKKYNNDMGRNFIHELGHRLWRKYPIDKTIIIDKFRQASSGFMNDIEVGDIFLNKEDKKIEVLDKVVDHGYTLYVIKIEGDKHLQKVPSGYFKRFEKVKGKPPVDPKVWIPSPYSVKDKKPEEWFCELLAYGLVDNNKMYKDFIRKAIK